MTQDYLPYASPQYLTGFKVPYCNEKIFDPILNTTEQHFDTSLNSVFSFSMSCFVLEILKRGDRRERIFSAHNNWWATPEVSLPLPYQRSAKVFLIFLRQGVKTMYYF